jgi:putative MATE family efflux protein
VTSGTGKTRLTLVGVAWPLFVEQFLRILILNVDTFMVSHVSDGAAGAVGQAGQVLMLSIIVFNFIAIGSSVVITHHLGAHDRAGADRIAAAAIGVSSWIGILASGIVAALAPFILRLQHLPPELMVYARPFLTILGATLFLDAQNLAMAAVLRAHGRTRDAMVVGGSANVLNVAGNCILLFGLLGAPRLGVTGVAISGVFARAMGFVALRLLVAKRTGIWLRWRDYLTFPVRELGRILHIGLPAAGENFAYVLALVWVTGFAARLGEGPLAVFTYTRTVTSWVVLFAMSIGLGTEILVGHLVGADALDEAYHRVLRSVRTGLLLVGGATIAVFLAGPWLFGAFTSDPLILRGCLILLVPELIVEPGRVFNVVVINALKATGDVRFPVLVGSCTMWGVLVPGAFALSQWTPLGVTGIWIAFACEEWLRGMIMYRRWRKRGWVEHARRSHASVAALASPGVVGSA